MCYIFTYYHLIINNKLFNFSISLTVLYYILSAKYLFYNSKLRVTTVNGRFLRDHIEKILIVKHQGYNS